MAYPGRPPIVPGIPLPPSIGMPSYIPTMMPPVMTMSSMVPVRPFRPSGPTKYLTSQPKKAPAENGPIITVFIGNFVEHAPDLMIRHILSACGQVVSWKRIQSFGFCEFGSPESALRAVRLLHELTIDSKQLIIKVDANSAVLLDEYKKAQRRKQGRNADKNNLDDYLDDRMRMIDRQTKEKIFHILEEFEEELKSALIEKEEENKLKKEIIQNLPDKNRAQKTQEILSKLTRDAEKSNIQDEFEEGKRDIITREIGKFREIMKKQEAEREEERLRREEEKGRVKLDKRSPSRSRSVSSVRSARSVHSIPSPPEPKHRAKPRRNRSHSRSREREDRKDKVSKRELDRAVAREREIEEELKENKKLEKKAREKEVEYQERLRTWEARERRKRKAYDKEREIKRLKEEETEREAKKLKEFLEDYDDERDDIKFYKGRELQKRIQEREREKESDDKDRIRERDEIQELKNKVLESEHANPAEVYEQLLQEHEEMYKPKLIIDVNAEQINRLKEKEREKEDKERARTRANDADDDNNQRAEVEIVELDDKEDVASLSDDDSDRGADIAPPSNHNTPSDHAEEEAPPPASPVVVVSKKKKLDVKDVFNADDDDSVHGGKRRKLVPLDYGDDKKEHKKKEHRKKDDKSSEENSKSTEEKRKHIKSLIDQIPTDRGALFEFTIDWSAVDNQLMERRIRPWINKKIIEYIGEPEPTLVDFICSKVLARSQPQGILDDVQMVLDEEAEVFVVKMWRLLIYEIEAKKLGLVK